MDKTITSNELLSALDMFTGTEHYYKHTLSGYVYTDGIHFLAIKANAFWLLDKILITSRYKAKLQEFGVWKLTVNQDRTAKLVCEDGNYNTLYTENLDYTDFPLKEIEVWFENGVLILPSEH